MADAYEPQFFGRYQLSGLLGQGGMGSVYLAQQTGPGGFRREVALKVIRVEEPLDEELRLMLLDEAQLTALVNHPNVVTVYEVGEHDGRLFVALERIHGINLATLLKRAGTRRLPLAVAAAMVAQACDGLHAAHELQRDGRPLHLIHRDVSLSNLMLDERGRVRVIDFGIARANVRRVATDPAIVRGNIAYMAPEQLAGQELDRTVDVYAAALILFELATGTHPFRREQWRASVPPLRGLCPEAPPALGDLVGVCLSLDPQSRPRSIDALGEALWTYARSHGCGGPEAVARHFHERGVSLAPPPVRPSDDLRPRAVPPPPPRTAAVATSEPTRIDLAHTLELERALATGERWTLRTTMMPATGRGPRRLALSTIEGLLPAPLLATCAGGALCIHCEGAVDPSTRASLYVDARQPSSRLERVLIDDGSLPHPFDVGHRRYQVQRVEPVVGRRQGDRWVAQISRPALTVLAPRDAHMLVVLVAHHEMTRAYHLECICIERGPR
ncbi:serine/threonine protein kinase [Nannocystis exedens]|uniref:Serine/threonine protein kinase n=1 Tax=Nannocystis exedens TaxID=54 RepID=A0A1I2FEB5_9BACT|nr:serine/threonine-protein kinase [Nannocystis exedens]PCC70522.1 Tyrosine-protein kinase MasK [Nannocystis exedens]SFF02920.1 serine/threonine protein kinase [Nannocystis exedens]